MFSSVLKTIYRKYINYCSAEKKLMYLRNLGVIVGDGTRFNCDLSVVGSEPYLVKIGEDCLFAGGVKIFTHDGGIKVVNSLYFKENTKDKIGKVEIGDNCFIGFNSLILPNVAIGNNCIIGAGSVVSKNIPDNCVVAGVPAKVICSIDEYHEKSQPYLYDTAYLSKEEKKAVFQK